MFMCIINHFQSLGNKDQPPIARLYDYSRTNYIAFENNRSMRIHDQSQNVWEYSFILLRGARFLFLRPQIIAQYFFFQNNISYGLRKSSF